jgi:hypothetical protein
MNVTLLTVDSAISGYNPRRRIFVVGLKPEGVGDDHHDQLSRRFRKETEMSPERSNAYRRVMKTLEDLGPSKLLDAEQQRIRYAADNLIFSADFDRDAEARDALYDVESLCRALVDSGRWEQETAMRLADDVSQCGPVAPVVLQAA